MTSLLEGAKKLVTRGSDLGARVEGLEQAVEAARGRLDDSLLDDTATVVERAAGRLRISAEHTIVALAGATGSGKSSTFNALTGLDLSAVGVRRPTTSWATACVWGSEGAPELLEWMGVPARHQVTRDSMLSDTTTRDELDGVVLLDLPDHDSTEVSHHLEVDRLVHHADLLVWILDPQKYADAAIHDRYLSQFKGHEDVMLVVLNQIDRVPAERRGAMVDDVRRLLVADGLNGVPVIPVSAQEGWGVAELRGAIAKKVASKKVARKRLEADVKVAAATLENYVGTAPAPKLSDERVAALEDALADAAGVPTVVKAVQDSTRLRANRATGWPVTAWASRFKPDPLKRLHLDLGDAGKELTGAARTSVPEATQVQRARVDSEVRALVDDATTGFRPAWASAVRAASVARLPEIGDRLDRALGATDLGAEKVPGWTVVVRLLQWLLIALALAGAGWLVLSMLSTASGADASTPSWLGLSAPVLMLVSGIGLGLLLDLVCKGLVAVSARNRAAAADARLRSSIRAVSDDLVVGPVNAELASYAAARQGLAAALR
ncbi:YfjP family GTPase [Nocardioides yefusunii]|uniref:YfjP family GTPase n=1 Tax=Nocardioides yefusunii TaxID=2500546 RepID=A0ABW1QZ01_9ACTN|nr:YfjP family GTPase [Nocardioides yefusunii]